MAWAPDYCDEDELTEFAHASAEDSAWVNLARSTASRAVDGTCHRQFGRVEAPEPRLYSARWSRSNCGWLVETADLMDLTGLIIVFDTLGDRSYSTTVDTAKVDWLPWEAADEGRPWERMLLRTAAGSFDERRGGFRVTASWGWAPIVDPDVAVHDWPNPITQAALMQGSRLIMRRDSPYGIAGSPEAGSEKRLLARVDPDVQVALQNGNYIRRTWAR